ncbi:MAG TPA: hypothetical protein VHW44_09145 [Pseudonocardiaceae bacterium]|nr:hypothetical protein [Pseudonocardiaceae bacterium]
MIALVRYALAVMLHSQRYLAPVLLFLAVLAVFTSNDPGPVLPVYALAAAALFSCAAWLTMTLLNIEEPVQRAITAVSAGGSLRALLSWVCVAVLDCLVLSALALLFPWVDGHSVSGVELLVGVEALVTCALSGVAIGLVCSRLVIRRPGYALLTALGLVLLLVLVRGLPPVNPMFRLLAGTGRPAGLVTSAGALTGVAVLLLVLGVTVTQLVATRRD